MSRYNSKSGHESAMSRRRFLGIGATGLAATALAGVGRRTFAGINHRGEPTAVIRTAEHFGDTEMALNFPPGWELDVRKMAGHDAPALTDVQIRTALRETINTRPVSDLAYGKRNVAIVFDDLTRPTPTHRIAPILVEELLLAGVKPENIMFHASLGSHSAMFQQDMAIKLGPEIVANYACWNHNPFHGFTDFGTTPNGIPVKLNSHFGTADLKICISGIKKHGLAGYGGGAKAVIPGVASFESIARMHNGGLDKKYTTAEHYVNNLVRLEIEHAARMAEVDMSINIVMNGNRDVAGVFAGDIVDAHRAAVRVAHGISHTDLPEEPADVVIFNHYPQSVEANFGFGPLALKNGGTIVLVQDTPAGQRKIHYLGWSHRGGNITRPERGLPVSNAGQVIVFNRFAAKWDELRYSTDVHFASKWSDVYDLMYRHHGAHAKVVVFPTAPLQHEGRELRI